MIKDANTSFRGKRLFLAIDLPDYLKENLSRIQEEIKGFNWVSPERYHLTLKFIGDIPGQYQPKIEKALEPIQVKPFMLPVENLGVFPAQGKYHTLWVGLDNGHPHLFQLQKRIEDALFQIGYEPEKRIYQPHITLARVSNAADEQVRQFLKSHKDYGSAPFKVSSFHLMRSERIEGLRKFEIEKTFPLAGMALG